MKALVTGGAGYLGSTLAPALLDAGHEVTVFDSLRHGQPPSAALLARDGYSFLAGDIRDKRALAEAGAGADFLIHLAAIPGYPACAKDPDEARSINVDGTRVVAEIAGRSLPVLFASTSSCYGVVEDKLCTEETPLRPVSLYGETKAQCERILTEQCHAVIYRIATAYGVSSRMRWDLLVNDFTRRSHAEGKLAVYEGAFRRSFLHVRDIARGFLLAAERFGEMAPGVFNLGDAAQNFSKLELCQVIAQHVPGLAVEEDPHGKDADQRNYAVSYDKVSSQGFRAETSLDRGIEELLSTLR